MRDGPVVPGQIPLGVQGQEAHPAGAGVLQIGVQEERRLAHAGRADHQAVDVVFVYQGGDFALPPLGAQHQPLDLGQLFTLPPFRGFEGDAGKGLADLGGGVAQRAVPCWPSPTGLDLMLSSDPRPEKKKRRQ